MITESNGFEFDKHILRLDKEVVRNKLKPKIFRRALNRLLNKEKFEELVDDTFSDIMFGYSSIKEFFDEMNTQKYCDIKYRITDYQSEGIEHTVEISHMGAETFNLNGLTRLYTINNSKITTIPVEKGADTFDLILFNHPQIEIPTVGMINVTYDFNTSFSLGKKSGGKLSTSIPFNKKILPRIMNSYSDNKYVYERWYGKPGEVYYRFSDGFYDELQKAIFGILICRAPREKSIDEATIKNILEYKRDRFKMHSTITFNRSNNFIYQGIIESSGAFPFFLWKDNDDGRNRRYIRKPVPSSTVKTIYN